MTIPFKRKRPVGGPTSAYDIGVHCAQVLYYELTEDTTFQEDKTYYTLDGETYSEATVITGNPIPASTYYELKYFQPHPQYLLVSDFQKIVTTLTAGDGTSSAELATHNIAPDAHANRFANFVTISTYNTAISNITGNVVAVSDILSGHMLPAAPGASRHTDSDGLELYAFRVHGHTASDVGAAAVDHDHDATYALAAHHHNDIYASVNHEHAALYAIINHTHADFLSSDFLATVGIYPESAFTKDIVNQDYHETESETTLSVDFPDETVIDGMYVWVVEISAWKQATVIAEPFSVNWTTVSDPLIPKTLPVDVDTITEQSFRIIASSINTPCCMGNISLRTYASQISEPEYDGEGTLIEYEVDQLYQMVIGEYGSYARIGESYTETIITEEESYYIKRYRWFPWIPTSDGRTTIAGSVNITPGETTFTLTPPCAMADVLFIELIHNGYVVHNTSITSGETSFTFELDEAFPIEVSSLNYVCTVASATKYEVLEHSANSNIHVTVQDKSDWNSKIDPTAFTNHINAVDPHPNTLATILLVVPVDADNDALHLEMTMADTPDFTGENVVEINTATSQTGVSIFDGNVWVGFPETGASTPYYSSQVAVDTGLHKGYGRYRWNDGTTVTDWIGFMFPATGIPIMATFEPAES